LNVHIAQLWAHVRLCARRKWVINGRYQLEMRRPLFPRKQTWIGPARAGKLGEFQRFSPGGLFGLSFNFLRMNQPHRSAAIVPQRFDHPPSRLERTYSPVKIKSRCSQPGRRRRAGCPRTGSPARLATALVTFEPGAHLAYPSDRPDANVVSGVGRVQISGGPVRPGDTVWTPPGEKHWARRRADHRHGPPRHAGGA
jgi:hypothetical protein